MSPNNTPAKPFHTPAEIRGTCAVAAQLFLACALRDVEVKIYWRKRHFQVAFQSPIGGEIRELMFKLGCEPLGKRTWIYPVREDAEDI